MVEISTALYEELIRDSEQLRLLKVALATMPSYSAEDIKEVFLKGEKKDAE